jgi:hypothetical protein
MNFVFNWIIHQCLFKCKNYVFFPNVDVAPERPTSGSGPSCKPMPKLRCICGVPHWAMEPAGPLSHNTPSSGLLAVGKIFLLTARVQILLQPSCGSSANGLLGLSRSLCSTCRVEITWFLLHRIILQRLLKKNHWLWWMLSNISH